MSTTIRSSIYPNASSWSHSQTIDSSLTSHELSFRYRVSCSSNFYGLQCSRFCSPLSSRSRCDPQTGDIQCEQGWKGNDCNQGRHSLPLRKSCRCSSFYSYLSRQMSTWSLFESTGSMSLSFGMDWREL